MWALAATYQEPHWLLVLHTITAAIGDILTPISILVGIILVVVRIGQMREEHRTQHQQVMDKLEQIQPSKGNE
jgi:branched-subunit amino acid permease